MNPEDEETKPRVPQETEAALAKKSLSEINMALDVEGERDFDFDAEARYVITDTGVPHDEAVRELIQADPTLGFEIIKTEALPSFTAMQNGQLRTFYEYNGQVIHSYIKALFVDRSVPSVNEEGEPVINFKGMRKNEVIDPAVIKDRLNKDVSFSVSIDDEGTLKVVNPDSSKKVTVLGFGDAQAAGVSLEGASPVPLPEQASEREGGASQEVVEEIEAEMDAASAEMSAEQGVESHKPLTAEEYEEIGDKGLDAAEVDDPGEQVDAIELAESPDLDQNVENEPEEGDTQDDGGESLSLMAGGEAFNEAEERAAAMHRHYERIVLDTRLDTAEELAASLGQLEGNGNALAAGERVLIDSAKTCVAELQAAVKNYDNYSVGGIQTYLRRTVDALYFFHGATLRFAEGEVGEVGRAVDAIEQTLATKVKEAGERDTDFKIVTAESGIDVQPGVQTAAEVVEAAREQVKDTEALKESLTALSEKVTGTSNGKLRGLIQQLEDIRQNSYSRPIDPDEIMQVTQAIVNAYDNDDVRTLLRTADTQLKAVATQTRSAIGTLQPAAQA